VAASAEEENISLALVPALTDATEVGGEKELVVD
jgi:hypothetical protein